jgi:predicted dehydrogenase
MLGCGFMGQAHAFGLRSLAALAPDTRSPLLVAVCGRDSSRVEAARARFGFARGVTDWRELLADDDVDVFDNAAPNALHAEPTIAAAASGRHVFCEKPLGRTADEAYAMWTAATRAQVVDMCGFNLRFLPVVRRARDMLEAGELGDPVHFRARFLASSALSEDQRQTWRFRRAAAGSGALGDLGSHLIDLARYLVGEPVAVTGVLRTFVSERDGIRVDVDDAVVATLEFANGALGTLEASRVAGRRANTCALEVDGTRGSLGFSVERLNELTVHARRKETVRIDVTDPNDPFMELWWPSPGHGIGWGDSFTHEMRHFLRAVARDDRVAPHGADFRDGYRCAEVCEAIGRSHATGQREAVAYRDGPTEDREPAWAASRARRR